MLGFASISRHPEVDSLVEKCGYAAAALTILPIPGSEIIGVMPLHVGMVVGIANHHGRTITRESATELILQIGATVGLSLVGSRLATTAAKFVLPGLGGLIAAPFMYASTIAIGKVADAWFEHGGELSSEQMKDLYNATARTAKQGFSSEKMRDDEAVDLASAAAREGEAAEGSQEAPGPVEPTDRLKRAKDLLDAGLIDQAEFDAARARILADL